MAEIVKCHSGHEYAERPTALFWEEAWLEIEAVEKQWRIPGGKCFRVRTTSGLVFELMYGELYDEWRINPSADETD
ncbi:MAG: hypothetical protein FJ030_06120 [Chloroflexi bacterium]|nr:hypothetical protein [Chloroflexota bacterium]